MKNKLKIQFFEFQIDYLLEFREAIETIGTTLKQIFSMPDSTQQHSALKRIYKQLQQQKQLLRQSIYQTKKQSDLVYDQAKIQQKVLYQSHEDKIQQLNHILYEAENAVQRAEAKKKEMDMLKPGYEMTNIKTFKHKSETECINKYLKAEQKVIREFIRSINLMFRISQRSNSSHCNKFAKICQAKSEGVSYNQLRRLQNFGTLRKALSCDKHFSNHIISSEIKNQLQFKQKNKPQPLLSLLLKSPHIKYAKQRQKSIKSLVHRTRQSNKKQTMLNKLLAAGIQTQKRNHVLNYLETRQQLNQQQSIAKIELMSSKLNQFIQQRFLSLQGRKNSKQFHEGQHIQSRQIQNIRRKYKSSEKLTRKGEEGLSQIKKRSFTITNQTICENKSSSNPKTNDSLTAQRFVSL